MSLLRATLAMFRAQVWLYLRRPLRALAVLDRALSRGAHGTLLRHRASALALLDRRAEAVQAYREALRFDPLDGTTRIEVVKTLLGWGWERDPLQAFVTQFDVQAPCGRENGCGPAG